jgi:hypothetical protein
MQWRSPSVTTRGFAAVAANKMFVMVDARTVYSPLFTASSHEHSQARIVNISPRRE